MTWWAWLLVWTVLVAGAVTIHVLLVRDLWRKIKAVSHEIGDLTRRIDAAGLQGPADPTLR